MGRWLSPLYVICDIDVCTRSGWDPVRFASACLAGGARILQIRAKSLASGPLLAVVDAVVAASAPLGSLVIVNDRPDIAAVAGAGGVHLGQEDLPPSVARALLGPGARVGLSTHTDAQLLAGVADLSIDHLAIGPVFGTTTKATGYDAGGLERVQAAAEVAAARELPVIAIGGITLERAADVIAAGASAVAVISDLVCADPAARVRAYLARLTGTSAV